MAGQAGQKNPEDGDRLATKAKSFLTSKLFEDEWNR